jgi:hypothetical protein
MNYAEYETIPPHVFGTPAANLPADQVRWVNDAPPPPIGTDVLITFNGLGTGTVRGYFVEQNYLGLLVQIHNKPDWYLEQNGPNTLGHVFGTEFKLC